MPPDSSKALSRTISDEEAREGYLRVNKTWLRKLPEPGEPFNLRLGSSELKVQIQRRDAPKEHYVLTLPLVDLTPGTTATLRPVANSRVVLELSA